MNIFQESVELFLWFSDFYSKDQVKGGLLIGELKRHLINELHYPPNNVERVLFVRGIPESSQDLKIMSDSLKFMRSVRNAYQET